MSLLHPGLVAFMAIARHQTVHGAARDIGLTQTGVTQRIRALERELSTSLFTRSRKGMRLTVEGEALLRYCQRVWDMTGEVLSQVQGSASAPSVGISLQGPSSLIRARIIPALAPMLEEQPNLVFNFRLDDTGSGLRALKSGEVQLAILRRHEVVDELDSRLLKPEVYVLVGPRAWKGRPLEDILDHERIVDFDASDEMTFQFLKKHRLAQPAHPERHLVNNTDALAMLVALGHGYSVLSQEFAEPLFQARKLVDLCPGKILKLDFALAWYPRLEMPSYFKAVIQALH